MAATPDRLLEIYLADHLAAATAGVELVRRAARSNRGNRTGDVLERLRVEIEEDRRMLRRVVTDLGFAASKPKVALAWTAEKVGRLKLNGRLRGYSPLSRVLELEALSAGIAGKQALWETLLRLPRIEQRLHNTDLAQLVERARRQRTDVEEARRDAVDEAFAGDAQR
jgi:hypothetical protein